MLKKIIKPIAVGIVFLVVVFIVLFTLTAKGVIFAQTNEGLCAPLPPGTAFVPVKKGIYTIEGTEDKIFILRGIALGNASDSTIDNNDNLPPCYSEEDGLLTLKGRILIDSEGNTVILVKGVGSEDASSLPEPTPLP